MKSLILKITLVLITAFVALTPAPATAQVSPGGAGGGGDVATSVPANFPEQIPATFEEAWDAAIARSTGYRRSISVNNGGIGELEVIGSTTVIATAFTPPGNMDTIDSVTQGDNPYFKLADDRNMVYISRSITDSNGFPTFEAFTSFRLEKLDVPVGYATHRIPEWARTVSYGLWYYTPIEVPNTATDAEFVTYNPATPWRSDTSQLQLFRRDGRTFVMMENWIFGDPNLQNSTLVIRTATGAGHYDFGNSGRVSTRGSYPLSIAPLSVAWNGGKKIRIAYPATGEMAPIEETIYRYGDEGQYLENVVYDIGFKPGAPAGAAKVLKFRVLGQWNDGGVAPIAIRIVTRNNEGVVVENATEPLNINSDLWFRVIVRAGVSSCRVWAVWPDGIETTNGQQFGRPMGMTTTTAVGGKE